jgi:hypothetical protein
MLPFKTCKDKKKDFGSWNSTKYEVQALGDLKKSTAFSAQDCIIGYKDFGLF